MKLTVSILGCGRLGLPLAQYLVARNYLVKGSTTTSEKIPSLKNANIEPYCFSIDEDVVGDDISQFFSSDVLIVTIPFLRSFQDPADYLKQIQVIAQQIKKSSIQRVIFTSSTSIYPDIEDVVVESMSLPLSTERQKVLYQVEEELMQACAHAVILRLGGIWHGQVSAELMLNTGAKTIVNSESRMNVVHIEDCVALIDAVLKQEALQGIFNVCADKHPYRREFYTNLSQKLGYNKPQFDNEQKTSKIVDNAKSKQILNFTYKHSDPLLF